MSEHHLTITGSSTHHNAAVVLDGTDIAPNITGLVLSMKPGESKLTLDIRIDHVQDTSVLVDAGVSPSTWALLTKLGWTPPIEAS